VDILPDDPRVKGAGLSHVPLMHGLPGLTVRVVPGNYVRLLYENGDPSRPVVALWPDGSSVQSVELQAVQGVNVVAPAIKLGPTNQPTQSALRGEAWMLYHDAFVQALTNAIAAVPGAGPAIKTAFELAMVAALPLKQQALSLIVKLE
jgi:hypothetical protein